MAPPNLIITDNFIIPWLEFSQTKTTWLCLFGEKINNFVKMFWVQSLCFHLIFVTIMSEDNSWTKFK